MATKIYGPQEGADIQQGLSNLGSLFGPPSVQSIVAQNTLQQGQADRAQKQAYLTSVGSIFGPGTAALLGAGDNDAVKHAALSQLFQLSQGANPDINKLDLGNYALNGNAKATFLGQQAEPLSENQSRIVPPALAAALGVPQSQHGIVALGDSKMMPGSGAQPISQDPTAGDDPEKAPKYGVVSEDQFGNKQYGYPQKYDPNNPSPQMGPNPGNPLLSLLAKPPATPSAPASGAPTAAPGPASGGTSDPLLSLLQSGTTPSTPFTPATPSAAPSAGPASSAAPATSQPASTQSSDVMSMHGNDFLSQLPPDIAGQVRAIGEGRAPYPSGMLLKTPYGQKLATFVTQAYPSFETGNPGARMRVRNEFTSGGPNTPAGSITAGNTAIQHLGELSDAADSLGNTSYPVVNGVVNMAKTQTGGGVPLTQFNNALNAFIEEKTKFYRGIGGNEADLQRDLASLSPNQSPDQLRAAIKTQVDLMNGKIGELQTRWHTGMGAEMPDFPIVSPKSQAVLDRITQRASNVPGLVQPSGAPTPVATAVPPTQQSSVAAGPGGSSQAAASGAGGPSAPQQVGAQPPAAPQQVGAQPPAAPQGAQPPMPGARQAPDGKWYVSDPARPGKYLQVGP